MYEDVWKGLTKGTEAPASASEDHGFSSQRPAGEVRYFHLLQDVEFFHSLTLNSLTFDRIGRRSPD